MTDIISRLELLTIDETPNKEAVQRICQQALEEIKRLRDRNCNLHFQLQSAKESK